MQAGNNAGLPREGASTPQGYCRNPLERVTDAFVPALPPTVCRQGAAQARLAALHTFLPSAPRSGRHAVHLTAETGHRTRTRACSR